MNYTAFGSPILIAPNAGFAKYLASHPFAFTGRTWDSIANMNYFRARTFDPMIGRFTSADPLRFEAGDMNLYRYLANSPFSGTDPSGKCSMTEYLIIISLVTAFVSVYNCSATYQDEDGNLNRRSSFERATYAINVTLITALLWGAFLPLLAAKTILGFAASLYVVPGIEVPLIKYFCYKVR